MGKTKYKTEHDNDPKEFELPAYSEKETKYKLVIDKNGNKKLETDGETNIYEQIQAHYADTDFETIVNQIKAGLRPYNDPSQGTYDTKETINNTKDLTDNHKAIKELIENANRSDSKPSGKPDKPNSGDKPLGSTDNPGTAKPEGKTDTTGAGTKVENKETK